jgi:hypothetical protein
MVDIKEINTLDGWVIALTNGLALIGRRTTMYRDDTGAAIRTLGPVFELKTAMAQDGRGNAGPVRMAFPLFLLSITEVELPDGALVIPCETLSRAEQSELRKAIDVGEDMLSKAKAAASGISVVREMPKVRG